MKRTKTKKASIILYLLFLFCACSNSTSTTEQEKTPVSAEAEDDLLLRLSSQLLHDPQTQAEKEKNQLLEYAIDKLLDIKEAPSGFFYQIAKEGLGQPAKWGDYVTAHYKGYFLDGKVFDSSYQRRDPMSFYVGNMIEGWNEGLTLMSMNSKAIFLIPSSLAYGERGMQKAIPPNTPLIFEIEILKIENK